MVTLPLCASVFDIGFDSVTFAHGEWGAMLTLSFCFRGRPPCLLFLEAQPACPCGIVVGAGCQGASKSNDACSGIMNLLPPLIPYRRHHTRVTPLSPHMHAASHHPSHSLLLPRHRLSIVLTCPTLAPFPPHLSPSSPFTPRVPFWERDVALDLR